MVKDWIIVAIVLLAGIALVIFLVKQNQKDKKALIQKLNNDYPKLNESEPEIDYKE
jgi:uncharacterized membrane-anchored protein YhcB (DUF1043 family)